MKDIAGYAAVMVISACAIIKLWLFKPKLLVYSIDKANGVHGNDFRMGGIYDFMTKQSISYIELFHTILGRQLFKNILRRRRSGIYLEAIDAVFYLTRPFIKKTTIDVDEEDLMRFQEKERSFVRNVALGYFQRAALSSFRARFLKRLLSASSIKAFWTIDDARNYAEILVVCKDLGIPAEAFQHGIYSSYFIGYLLCDDCQGRVIAPDHLWVTNDYWKGELKRLGCVVSDDRVLVSGPQRKTDLAPLPVDDGYIGVMFLYETETDKEVLRAYLLQMLDDKSVKVFFKVRRDRDTQSQLAEYGLDKGMRDKLTVMSETKLDYIDVVLGTYSTFLYEMVESGRPVAILKTRNTFGKDMITNGLADLIDDPRDTSRRLKELAMTSRSVLESRRNRLLGKGGPGLESVLLRLAERDRLI